MAAEIIQLPDRRRHNRVRSVDLHFCWDSRLNNPFLNKLFKEEVCYVERWYLQTTHLLNVEDLCFNSLDSGKRPASLREKIGVPLRRTSKIPPAPGTSVKLVMSEAKVVSSSCVIHEARSNQLHCVQYSISTLTVLDSM